MCEHLYQKRNLTFILHSIKGAFIYRSGKHVLAQSQGKKPSHCLEVVIICYSPLSEMKFDLELSMFISKQNPMAIRGTAKSLQFNLCLCLVCV